MPRLSTHATTAVPAPPRSASPLPRRLLPTALTLLAIGCTTLTPAGLLSALRTSPLSADPAALRVGLALPGDVVLRTGDATLRFAYVPDDDRFADVDESFELHIEREAALPGADAADALFSARVAPADVDRFAVAQARVREMKVLGDDGVGTLQLRVNAACHLGPRPDAVPFQSWLRSSPDDAWVPLTRRVDLLETLGEDAAPLVAALAPCGESGRNAG